jgi:sialidase-1
MVKRCPFLATTFLLLALADVVPAAEPEQTPVFVSGQDGYHTYRIPSLLVTPKGTLLAFCEGRKKGRGDAGDIDVLLKRSVDGGKTWTKLQVVWDDGENTCGNPCPVLDPRTGTIWLLLTHNLGGDTEARIVNGTSKGTRTVWVTKSDDDGVTWSKPVEITKDVKKSSWTWYATGPGVGIALKSGRLVVPCDNQVAGSQVRQAHVLVSDDSGKTWKLGGVVGPQCNESQVVELRDGSLLLNCRSYRGNNRRLVALSKDGGETFAKPVEDEALIEPVCQASLLRYPGERGRILFANPASTKRERMTVRLSTDEGKSWPRARVLHDGPSAYSCLAVLPDGLIGCLYERGDKHPYETITLARLALTDLGGPKTTSTPKQQDEKQMSWKQRQFFITFWGPPPAEDKALASVAAEHYNLTWVPAEGLEVAARHGLRALLTNDLLNPATLDDPAKRVQLDALIKRVKNHPALEAYYLTDEPGSGAFPGLGKLVAYLRERDPTHFAYINLYATYATEEQLTVSADAAARTRVGIPQNFAGVGTSDKTVRAYRDHLKQYLEIVKPDLLSYDHYHFLQTGDGEQYFLNLALIRQAALEANKPFLNIVQASTAEKAWRRPNAREVRFLAFTILAYGGRGISYFLYEGPKALGGLYQDGQPTPLAKDVALLNAEIARFGPVLLTLDSTGVYHTAPLPYGSEAIPANAPVQITGGGEFVLGLFGKEGQTTAFLVVNRSYKREAEALLKVALPGKKLQELDRLTGQWSGGELLGADRTVKVQLGPGDGRLFRVIDEKARD